MRSDRVAVVGIFANLVIFVSSWGNDSLLSHYKDFNQLSSSIELQVFLQVHSTGHLCVKVIDKIKPKLRSSSCVTKCLPFFRFHAVLVNDFTHVYGYKWFCIVRYIPLTGRMPLEDHRTGVWCPVIIG